MGIDHEKLKQARAGARGGSGWKTQPGANRVFVLPPHSRYLNNWEELENLAIPYKMHFFKIEGRVTEATRCLEDLKQRCPACNTWRIFRKHDDPALKEMAKQISPSDQYLFNMLDINNIQAGVQRWAANWTCWDKIMEIAANPAWGDVCDPANGVIFVVTMLVKGQTRSGRNAYSATPEPQRITMMEVLKTIENWQGVLDELEGSLSQPKEDTEIRTLLDEIGFPTTDKAAQPPAAQTPGNVATLDPEPVMAPGPTEVAAPGPVPAVVATPPANPSVVAAPAVPQTVTPSAEPTAPAPGPAVVPAEATGAPPLQPTIEVATTVVGTIHYDPGTDYIPKMTDAERPANAPRCFADYDPRVHQCAPCPATTTCQLKMLGVAD